MDPAVAAYDVVPVAHLIAARLEPVRWYTFIIGMLGLLSSLLASSGLAGLLLYIAHARRPEMSLRVALGANAAQMRNLMLRLGLRLSVTGIIIGSLLGAAALHLARRVILVDDAALLLTVVSVALLMTLITLAASWWPARVASRTEPRDAISMM